MLPSVAGQVRQTREPASRAAVVLTWTQAQRETGFAGMENLFLTRTVRAGSTPRPLPDGRRVPAFASGGARTDWFEQFVADQKIAGVLDMTVTCVRTLPREAPPGTKWVYKTSETNLVGVLVMEACGGRSRSICLKGSGGPTAWSATPSG